MVLVIKKNLYKAEGFLLVKKKKLKKKTIETC